VVEPERVYLLGDVDAIKEYVFESSWLPQIRGGSQLLMECEDRVREAVEAHKGAVVYCAGGRFLVDVPREEAPRLQRLLEEIYVRETGAATATVVYEEEPPVAGGANPGDGWADRLWRASTGVPLDGRFAQRVALLDGRLRHAKARRASAPFYEALPFARRCDTCSTRIASTVVSRSGGAEEPAEEFHLCAVCFKRDETGRNRRHEARGRINQEFQRYAGPRTAQPPDLDHLVKSARRAYLALVYADGNDIGRLLQRVDSAEQYRAISEALKDATKNALFATLREVCRGSLVGENGEEYWPFEIVNVGGDDVIVLAQAGYAWDVAVGFLDRFTDEVRRAVEARLGVWPEGWPARVTAACGVAVADVKYPVRFLRALAEQLLGDAKRRAKEEDPGSREGAVSYLWLTNPIVTDQSSALLADYDRGTARLTARPYSLSQAKGIARLARQALRWPSTTRHQWARSLEQGVYVSLNAIFYDVARTQEEDRLALHRFLAEVGRLIEGPGTAGDAASLWHVDVESGRFRTALLDVLELAELYAMRPDVQEGEEVP